ncbi:hypothetical protein PPERSA_01636 [Pseudocohnilembus persalinus]|uniref:Uncharacterized protein n=1 Tax=Pseudocohnilembus persalinus TaxID=266149 RepID=A0A0V0R4M9_PSEPJ|nr:hypothetical protein PPERSA_01636 [Pseudocohnilembus persalinus]|eukprot:KRX09436.1 hypothetical protein PPERSA_01636 [Pseudocohnilembus persalinus]
MSSLTYIIFYESLERKLTSFESNQILKNLLWAQTKIFNEKILPIFQENQVLEVQKFFHDYFYRFYNLYEITMTKFVDSTIQTNNNFNKYIIKNQINLQDHKEIDPKKIEELQDYIINENEEVRESQEDIVDQSLNGQSNGDLSQNMVQTEQDDNLQQQQNQIDIDKLNEQDKNIYNYVQNKVENFNQDYNVKKSEREQQLEQNVNNILNPPKKK